MTAEDLAARVLRGVEALRAGRPHEAVEALEPVARDPEFEAAPELDDVRARVWSLFAQALHDSGRSRQAEPWARKALAAAGTDPGAEAVRVLHRAIFAAAAEAAKADRAAKDAAALAATPLARLVDGADAATLVAKANADLDDGRPHDGALAAGIALDRARAAGDLREEVLALMTLARAKPDEAATHLNAAWAAADAAGEFNLVGAVARAAELAGVAIAVVEGPGGSGA